MRLLAFGSSLLRRQSAGCAASVSASASASVSASSASFMRHCALARPFQPTRCIHSSFLRHQTEPPPTPTAASSSPSQPQSDTTAQSSSSPSTSAASSTSVSNSSAVSSSTSSPSDGTSRGDGGSGKVLSPREWFRDSSTGLTCPNPAWMDLVAEEKRIRELQGIRGQWRNVKEAAGDRINMVAIVEALSKLPFPRPLPIVYVHPEYNPVPELDKRWQRLLHVGTNIIVLAAGTYMILEWEWEGKDGDHIFSDLQKKWKKIKRRIMDDEDEDAARHNEMENDTRI